MDLCWQAVDKQSGLCTKNLRPLAMALDFASSSASGKVWLAALQWIKEVFARQQRLTKQPLAEILPRTVPKRLRDFLLRFDHDGKPVGLRGDRYEFWVYRQLARPAIATRCPPLGKSHRVLPPVALYHRPSEWQKKLTFPHSKAQSPNCLLRYTIEQKDRAFTKDNFRDCHLFGTRHSIGFM